MSSVIFEWTRTVISQQYLDSMTVDCNADKHSIIKELALTAKVKVERNDGGQIFLEGGWDQILNIHIMLVKYLKLPEVEKNAKEDKEVSSVPNSSVPKTKTNSVLRYIKQKYLIAKRRRNEMQFQRNSAAHCKRMVPKVEEVVSQAQENEVYVNITDFSKISGFLLPVSNLSDDLPYQVPMLESNADEVLINSDGLFVESDEAVQRCEDSVNENIRTSWHNDINNGGVLYSLSCNEVETQGSGVHTKEKSSKKKDYEKLAPFKFFCKLCSFKSKRESHYQRHMELHSKVSELFSCKKCDFTTIRLGHLRRHEMSHSDTKFACTLCHYHTDHHKFLLRHQRIKHCNVQGRKNVGKKEVLRCVECSYSTTRAYFYQRHVQSHASSNGSVVRDELRFHCQQCSYKTGRKEHYIRHVNNVHNNKRPYLCDHCGKAFKRPDALKQHRVTHVDLDPSVGAFCCPVCGKCCRAQAQLTQHLTVHSNVRSFLCEICGSSFKTRAVQRKHILTIHKNPKAFCCTQCSRKFNTKYALRRHMKQHSLDKKRKCEGSVKGSESAMCVIQSEPIPDNQTAITVQVIGFVQPYSDT